MNIETRSIPNLQIENIGGKNNPLQVIKGFIVLPCWDGYYLYNDTYALKKDKAVTGGRIELWVDGEITPGSSFRISGEQVYSYFYLAEHQKRIQYSMLEALKEEFPRLLSNEYASMDHEDPDLPKLSDLTQEFDFKNYIGPEFIRIGEEVKDGAAYISWHFRCRWDVEHGIEIVTHKERVIEIAPEADPWKIYKDNGTFEQMQQEYKDSMRAPNPPKQKKWWQFW